MKQDMKNDRLDGKLRWELLPVKPIEEVVDILTYGAQKYADESWRTIDNGIDRYYAAAMRHLIAWRKGEDIDPVDKGGSGRRHLAHAFCNLLFLLELTDGENKTT